MDPHRETQKSTRHRYAISLLGVALATLGRIALIPVLATSRPLATYYLATAVTSLVAGIGPAVLSIVLSMILGKFLFIESIYSMRFHDHRDAFGMAMFMLINLVVAFLGESLRNARRAAVEGQEALRREMEARQDVEHALRDREARFRALIEHGSDVVTTIAADGTILYISPSIERILGYRAEELVGGSGLREIHPDDHVVVQESLAKAIAQPGVPFPCTFRVRHRDGSWRWVENVGTSFLHEPSIAAVVVNTRDVTESREMANQIRQAESRFRAFMDHSPAISFIKDEEGRYVWGNLAWETQLGKPVDELIGKHDLALWPEEIASVCVAGDQEARASGRLREAVEEVGGRHFMSLKFPLEHEGRRFLGGMALDVTDRVAAESAVHRSETLLHALADSMPEIVWAAQPDGRVDYFNRRWFEFTGLSEAESYAPTWATILHPDDLDRCLAVWDESIRSGNRYEIEYRFADRKNGGYRWHLGRALPVRDDDGQILRWYGSCTDIDDQKTALQIAENANQAKNRFLAVLSHELRTPLTPVLLSVSSLLEDQTLGPDLRNVLEMARRNIALESRLIDDLLDVTQISRGKLALRNEIADAHTLIHQALEVCRGELDAAGVRLDVSLDATSTTISADPARFQQVIWNLVKNSAKFTPRGGRIAIQSGVDATHPEGRLVIEVADDGIGIEPEFLPRMFEPFEQAEDSPWTRRHGGLGLGLAISLAVIEGLGGTLTATSEGKGRGAKMRIKLPLAGSDTMPRTPTNTNTNADAPRAVTGLRILLIEDDPSTLSVLSRLLRRSLHVVTTADSVAAAIAESSQATAPFDLIISDIGLPDGNGVDLMRDLQARAVVPAIAISGHGQDEDIQISRSVGFHAHLTKPIDYRELEETINFVMASAT